MKTVICYDCRTKFKLSEKQIASGFACSTCGNKNLSIKESTEINDTKSKINGYVYVASNPNIRGLKIGYTDRLPEQRMKELSSETGVPGKFELVHAEPSSNPSNLERQVHQALRSSNFSKEFFDVSPTEAIRTVQKVSEQIELANKEKIKKQVNASPQIKKYFGEISSQKQNLQFSEFSKTEPRSRKVFLDGEAVGSVDLIGKDTWKTSIKPLHSLRGQRRLKLEHLIAPESGLQHYTQAGFRIHNYNYEGKVSATSLGDTTLGFLKARIADVISFSIAPITFDVRHLRPFDIISPLTPRPNIVILLGNLPIGDIFLTESETGFFTKTTEYIAWHCFSADLIRIVGNRYGSEPIKKFSIASAHFDYLDYVQTDEFQLDCALKFQYELEAHDIVNFLIDD